MPTWTETLAEAIRLNDNIRMDGKWATVTAVHVGADLVDVHAGSGRVSFAPGTHVMVLTAEKLDEIVAARRDVREEWERRLCGKVVDLSEPWYLKLLNNAIERWSR
jgi:hypothetical protein